MKAFALFTLVLAFFSSSIGYAKDGHVTEFDPTFTHVVYFWFKNPESAADRAQFETSIKKFMKDSKYAKTRFVGVAPKATRDVVDDSFTYSLILSFESAEAQENYQAEEAHVRFVEECKTLWSKVIVYDSTPLK
ncbi:Dabb family protein [Pelagicoccus mobilis]|uniref:Dabb family protein n=1 Tax=Pelagicoccus mobilis TaxID=415221 RepID=A0A934VNW1_9BACT|nr:Dabb family protein [Pelagicoccus mobilis]MBK1880371.1 Dabb family protein [Pelagicoccus mobilis]